MVHWVSEHEKSLELQVLVSQIVSLKFSNYSEVVLINLLFQMFTDSIYNI